MYAYLVIFAFSKCFLPLAESDFLQAINSNILYNMRMRTKAKMSSMIGRPSVVFIPSTCSNISSKTTWPIKAKLGVRDGEGGGANVHVINFDFFLIFFLFGGGGQMPNTFFESGVQMSSPVNY